MSDALLSDVVVMGDFRNQAVFCVVMERAVCAVYNCYAQFFKEE